MLAFPPRCGIVLLYKMLRRLFFETGIEGLDVVGYQ